MPPGDSQVGDLVRCTEGNLLEVRNLGAGSLAEIRRVLKFHGLALAGEKPGPRP